MRTRSPWNLHCEGKGLRVFRSPVVNLPGPWMITRTGTSLWLKCIFQIPRFDTDKSLALGFMRDRQLRDPLLPSRFRGVRLAFSKRLDYSLGRPLGLEQLFYGANIVLSVPMNRLSSSLSLKEVKKLVDKRDAYMSWIETNIICAWDYARAQDEEK